MPSSFLRAGCCWARANCDARNRGNQPHPRLAARPPHRTIRIEARRGQLCSSARLRQGRSRDFRCNFPTPPRGRDRDVLAVGIDDGDGRELWHKNIPVMLVREPPRPPRFGASYEKLRFDAPISVRDPATGKYSTLRYDDAWNRSLHDIVVWLPNGSRFVFWRGSSYIPFWAGRYNTGACYEWAEIISQPKGAVDCVEPLMDKELRYSKVEIVEADVGSHSRALDLSVDRLSVQGLGRPGGRGLLLLSRRLRHPRASASRPTPRTTTS